MLGRLFLIGGLTYIVGSTCRLLVAKPLLLLVPILPILIFGAIFNWSHYDDSVRIASILFLWFFAFCVAGLFLSGQVVIGAIALLPLILLIHGVHSFSENVDSRWDTPERRFADSLENACTVYAPGFTVLNGVRYEYSATDGYCHVQMRSGTHIGNFGGVDEAYSDADDETHPLVFAPDVPGALENIQRLKAAMLPPVVAEPAASPGFVSRVIGHMHLGPFIFTMLLASVVSVLKWRWDARKTPAAVALAMAAPQASQLALTLPEPDPHAWLAEGRKAAGLS